MKKTKWSLLLVLALVLSMFLAACGGDDTTTDETDNNTDNTEDTDNTDNTDTGNTDEEADAEEDEILRILDSAEIPSLDSRNVTDSVGIQWLSSINEGLYAIAPGGEIVPGVATDHTVSEDGLTWTFNLREDAVWANGDPVVAGDFVYAWQQAISPEVNSVYGPYLMNGVVKNAKKINNGDLDVSELGVKAEGDHKLVISLLTPTPYFSSFAAFPTFYPLNQEFVEAQGEKFGLEAENVLSNGPFVMTDWKHENSWTLVKSDTYWDKDNVDLEGIEVKVVKDRATAINLFETGKIDTVGVAGEFVDKYRADPRLTILDEAVIFWLQFNQDSAQLGEYMQNKDFRNALSQAWDKEAYVDVILGNGSKAANFFVPGGFYFDPETGEDFRDQNGHEMAAFDPDSALESWNKAKEAIGFEEVTVSYLTGDTENSKLTAEFLKNTFETTLPGLTLELKMVPFKERLRLEEAQEFEISLSGWGPDYGDPMTFLDLWVTDGKYNRIGYSNERYDELIDAAKNDLATQPKERWEALLEAERVLMEDGAISPMYQRSRMVLRPDYLHGMDTLNPFGNDYSYKWVEIKK